MQRQHRRLAAILAADVAGYSRLMAADEAGTLARLNQLRAETIGPKLAQFNGQIVGSAGDSLLIEFASAVDAVQCAVELQEALAGANVNQTESRRMTFRMGVNLGDVIAEGGTIYGDGVNIASRLEKLAEPGSVCIGRSVYEQVKGKLDYGYSDLGEQRVHNIPEPVHAYRVRSSKLAPDSATRTSRVRLSPPAKPSIAVLPFINMSSIRDQEFFADGMTEDLITALSRIRELFVIARDSSFAYKGRAVRMLDIAGELGVRYILEGSVRVAGNRVRVTAQLIDGLSGGHVWSENYDGTLDDIFAVQDEITRKIVLALQVKLTYGESARLWEGQTQNLRAWEKMVFARDKFFRFNRVDNRDAQRALKEALTIDPAYTGAMVQLGMTYFWEAKYDISADREGALQHAEQQVERIVRIDPEMGSAFMLRGGIAFLRGLYEEGIRLCQKAVDLAPSDSWSTAFLATMYVYAGESEKATAALKTALRLSPYNPSWYTFYNVLANLWSGDLPTAQEAAEIYLQQEPDEPYGYINLATVYGFQQRADDAARVISELKARFPAFGMKEVIFSQCYRQREKLDRVVEVLRRAGLPE
jgi:adenylate cyclase